MRNDINDAYDAYQINYRMHMFDDFVKIGQK